MPRANSPALPISAVVLAGGRARRMGGGDKGLILFRGAPMVATICAALARQVAEIIINANRNLADYRQLARQVVGHVGARVIEDNLPDHQGPLAGMHVALMHAAHDWVLTAPCDGPFIADDYAHRLMSAAKNQNAQIAIAHDGNRAQPVYSLIHRDLSASLEKFLQSGERKIDLWHAQHACAHVDFSDAQKMFININTPTDLADAERIDIDIDITARA